MADMIADVHAPHYQEEVVFAPGVSTTAGGPFPFSGSAAGAGAGEQQGRRRRLAKHPVVGRPLPSVEQARGNGAATGEACPRQASDPSSYGLAGARDQGNIYDAFEDLPPANSKGFADLGEEPEAVQMGRVRHSSPFPSSPISSSFPSSSLPPSGATAGRSEEYDGDHDEDGEANDEGNGEEDQAPGSAPATRAAEEVPVEIVTEAPVDTADIIMGIHAPHRREEASLVLEASDGYPDGHADSNVVNVLEGLTGGRAGIGLNQRPDGSSIDSCCADGCTDVGTG